MNKTDYNRFEMTYLTDNIKFADQKAGLLIGLDGLLLRAAVEFFHSAGVEIASLFESARSVGHLSVILGSIFLIVGIISALTVVFPRRSSVASKGLVFWESIVLPLHGNPSGVPLWWRSGRIRLRRLAQRNVFAET